MPLVLKAVNEAELDIVLNRPITFVGREDDCDVQFSDRSVSRRHCAIALVNDRCCVRDLGSTNGTHVNGERVESDKIVVLQPNDVLCIANREFRLEVVDDDKQEPPLPDRDDAQPEGPRQ